MLYLLIKCISYQFTRFTILSMSKVLREKDTAIFDFDGTLSDTLGCNYQLDTQLLSKYGASITEYDYHALGGLTFTSLCAEF